MRMFMKFQVCRIVLLGLSGQYIAECLYACVHVNLEAVGTIRVSALVRVSGKLSVRETCNVRFLGSPTAPNSLL